MNERKLIRVSGSASLRMEPDFTIITVVYDETFGSNKEAYESSLSLKKKIQELLSLMSIPFDAIIRNENNISEKFESKYDENDHYIGNECKGYSLKQFFAIKIKYSEDLTHELSSSLYNICENFDITYKHTIDDLHSREMEALKNAVLEAKNQAGIIASSLGYSSIELHLIERSSAFSSIELPQGDGALYAKRNELKAKLLNGGKITLSSSDERQNEIKISQTVNSEWFVCE